WQRRAGMAARSMELAGFGGLVFGLGPVTAPSINSHVGVPVLGLSGPTVAHTHNNNLILSGPVPTRVHAPALGPVPASISGLYMCYSLLLLRVPAPLRPP